MPDMTSHLMHHAQNTTGNDFAVGDIHGCFELLQSALNSINFSPDKDRLFSVGDLVDRGSESHHVLDWLAKPWFHAICGNHDLMAYRSALNDPYPHVDHHRHGGEWLTRQTQEQQTQIGQQLAALPIAAEVETPHGLIGLIHADYPYDDWSAVQENTLSDADIESCLWSVDRHKRHYTQPVQGLRALVQGHLTLRSMQVLGNVHYIDTGGWRVNNGYFTFLNLHSLEPIAVPSGVQISRRYR
jgi:serine/threonine protein phosphatase 1